MSVEALDRRNVVTGGRKTRIALRTLALGYLALLLMVPVGLVFYEAFADGIANAWNTVTSSDGIHAFYLTMLMVVVAIPINTVFGVAAAVALVRHKWRGKFFVNALIDLPFAISPVVIGIALILVYSSTKGWFGPWLTDHGIQVIFNPLGMAIATMFVSLPFVVREVVPVLQEIGDDQEQAARTLGANGWQTFWRVTLPAIRWGVTYGVVLATARALGEFGAVSVVAGNVSGQTETLPLFVRRQYGQVSETTQHFNVSGAYAAALVLAVLALSTLLFMNLIQRRRRKSTPAPAVLADTGVGTDPDPKPA